MAVINSQVGRRRTSEAVTAYTVITLSLTVLRRTVVDRMKGLFVWTT